MADPAPRDTGMFRAVAGQGRTADALDPVIHERMRLAILSALAVDTRLAFVELKELLGATDGNLSVHARRLEEAGLIRARRTGGGPAARTEYSITAAGRRALEEYLRHMEELIAAVRARR